MSPIFRRLSILGLVGIAFGLGYFTGKPKGGQNLTTHQAEGGIAPGTRSSIVASADGLATANILSPVTELRRDFDALTSVNGGAENYADLEKQAQILKEIAEQDPELALRLATQEGSFTDDSTIVDLLGIWAAKSPENAWGWAVAQQFEKSHLVLEEIAKVNPELAQSLLKDFKPKNHEQRVNLLSSVVKGFVHNGNYEQAFDFILELEKSDDDPSTSDLFGLMGRLTESMAKFNPEEGFRWLDSLPESQSNLREEIKPAFLEEWALSRPQQALEFAMDLPEGQERGLMIELSLAEWAEEDIEGASAWVLESGEGPEFDEVALDIANRIELDSESIENSLAWINSMQDAERRKDGVTGILTKWLINDRANAESYILQNGSLPIDSVAKAFELADFNAAEVGPQ
ncbi:hypothetical protein OAF27_01415 [Verrucomicrobiales bacterium]|nr:hypothetical protein [Verrucomicrobiales bacterium]